MQWLLPIFGAVLGGVVGYSQWLCPDGHCAITGSWYGGAILGLAVGALIREMLRAAPRQP